GPQPARRRRGGRAAARGRGGAHPAGGLPRRRGAGGRGGVGERHDRVRGAHRAAPPAARPRAGPTPPPPGLLPGRRHLPRLGGHARAHGTRAGRAPRGGGDRAHGRAVLPLPAPPRPPARARLTAFLEADRVSFAYGPRAVLSEVSVAVAPG